MFERTINGLSDSNSAVKEESPTGYRFPWDSFIAGAFSSAIGLPFVSCCVFSCIYNALRGSNANFWHLFGPADESSGLGIVVLAMFHMPYGFLVGALFGYCWGMAKNRATRRAYLVSHWSGLLLGTPLLALTAFSITATTRGWLLSSFIFGFPLLVALLLFCLSYKFLREMR